VCCACLWCAVLFAALQPLRTGWLVESLDGQPVSKPLMGRLTSADMGSMRIHTLPNFWVHASSDHMVSARLTPLSVYTTEVKADWVRGERTDGRADGTGLGLCCTAVLMPPLPPCACACVLCLTDRA
jgi:hypothetical protein